ncbi:MAG: hypothetical protein B6I22_04955 [Desulfobacteraceae bacterium 4572_123]|nr:MAG: hypothetical protein B6I22_04955 [Desulfobacteraceae bacterium 4572_123]
MIFLKQHIGIQRTARLKLYKIISTVFVILAVSISSQAAEILDDSQSPKKQFNVRFEWEKHENLSSLSKDEFFLLKAHIPDVEVRLNTTNYIGKKARIYLALPSQIDGFNGSQGFSLAWKTTGILSSGVTSPGNRALIFEGLIGSSLLTEFFTFILKLDANRLTGKLRYAPIYEIELY